MSDLNRSIYGEPLNRQISTTELCVFLESHLIEDISPAPNGWKSKSKTEPKYMSRECRNFEKQVNYSLISTTVTANTGLFREIKERKK
jgi:hypothetical protein